ncbi:hypothetical protein SteCoe_31876 [Stentor coeruleus]|uniref:Uncharacterized protein n=1 Tax=Stentor coeruleus TaxID=5963 RepID=A0A1R2B081_9CILI|nr:hypothetical protein SteCoe_31876 [Stentor coeruleus]
MSKKFFAAISKLYPRESLEKAPSRTAKFIFLISHTMIGIQRIRLIWRADFSVRKWSQYEHYWHYLVYLSPDQLFSVFGGLLEYFLVSSSLLGTTIVLFASFILLLHLKKSPNQMLKKTLKFLLELQADYLFMPSIFIYCLLIKYSFITSNQIINETLGQNSSLRLSLGPAGVIIGLLNALLTIILTLTKEGFCYDIQHESARKSLTAKALPLTEIHNKLITVGIIVLYVFISDKNYYFYLIVSVIGYAYLTLIYVFYLPYYSNIPNTYKALVQFEGFCVTGFFAIGLILNNATVILLLSTFMQPLIVLIVYAGIEYRKTKLPDFSKRLSLNLFELACRTKLLKEKPSNKICIILQNYFKKRKEGIVLVFLAYHLSLKLEQSKNALIQISKAPYTGSNLFYNFQIYKCQKYLEKINYERSEGLKLKVFTKSLTKLKRIELKLCDKIVALCESLRMHNPSLSDAKRNIRQVNTLINHLCSKYLKTLEKYPQSEILSEMYGSLLILLGKPEHGKKLLNQSALYHEKNRKRHRLTRVFSDKNSHIMIISANTNNFGLITFISRSLCQFLSIIPADSSRYYLNNFVPKQYHQFHYKTMQRYLKNFNQDKIFHNLSLCLLDSYGYLVECSLSIDCIGYQSNVEFIVGVNPIQNMGREIAIITIDGKILNQSKGLAMIIDEKDPWLEGKNIFDYFPMINCEMLFEKRLLIVDFGISRELKFRKLGLFLQTKALGSTEMNLLYAIYDSNIIRILESEDISNLSSSKLSWILRFEANDTTENIYELSPEKSLHKTQTVLDKPDISTDTNVISHVLQVTDYKKTRNIVAVYNSQKIFVLLCFIAITVSNIITLISVNNEVHHSIGLDAVNIMGKTNAYLVYIGFISRSLYLSSVFNQTTIFTKEDLLNYLNKLPDIRVYLQDNSNNWGYWDLSSILRDDILPIYSNYSNPQMTKTNLLDILHKTYFYGSLFLQDLSKENLYYIMFNTFRLTIYEIQDSFTNLIKNEKQRLKNLNSQLDSLFYVGVCIISVFGVLAFLVIYPLHVYLKGVWSQLHKAAVENFSEVLEALNSRLRIYYDKDDDMYPHEDNNPSKILSFPHFKHYFLRISAVIMLGILFYILSMYIFFASVQDYMLCKLDFAQSMMNRRVYVYQRTVFLTELYADYKETGFTAMYGFSPMPPSKIGYQLMADKMASSRRDVFQRTVQKVMSSTVWDETFADIDDENGLLRFGLSTGYVDIKWESLFLSTNYKKCDFGCYQLVNQELKDLMIFFNKTSSYTDDSSTIYLENSFKQLVIFISGNLMCLFLIIICYIIPYFTKEQNIIKCMQISSDESEGIAASKKSRETLYKKIPVVEKSHGKIDSTKFDHKNGV